MTIQQFHNSGRQLMNIGQSQHMPPEDIDLQLNNAITSTWRQEYKHFEATQEISDTLGFYKEVSDPIVLDAKNQIDLPGDYYHVTAVEAILEDDTRSDVDVLKDSQWLPRKHSKDFAPSDDFPIARPIGRKKLEVLPATVKSVVIFYLRKPATAKYGYVINPDQTTWTYDDGNSTQVDWPEVGHVMIQDKMLSLLGLGLRDADLMNNETRRKNQNEDQ